MLQGWAVDNDCPWDKNNLNSPPSGISSVGVELTTGTSCTFTLDYNVKIDGRNGRNGLSSAACTGEVLLAQWVHAYILVCMT